LPKAVNGLGIQWEADDAPFLVGNAKIEYLGQVRLFPPLFVIFEEPAKRARVFLPISDIFTFLGPKILFK
jgi:hypothetical protein